MPHSNELRVFISSTFRDLQGEREHLVKKIFPEIRALCRERGVTFTDIDLRWGITEEEAKREGIIRICLDEIDRCRPYFIGILGERYGWTPPLAETERVADTFPALADAMMQGTSITEMEIVHGVLANPAMADHAFFYFRDRTATPSEFIDTDQEAIARLKELKNRIRGSGFPVRESFSTPVELGEWLQSDLWRVLDNEHPASEAPSALEIERRSHMAFAASRHRGYIPNPVYLTEFNEWVVSHRKPLVIGGVSGLGKSSLIAYLVEQYRRRHPTALIIEHYIGASQTSGSSRGVMLHVIEEIRERFAIDEPIPEKAEEIERSFPNWLFRLEHLAVQQSIEVLVVIDALNQLDEAGQRLAWLPRTIPVGVGLLISTTPGVSQEQLSTREWSRMEVTPIEDEGVRQSIIARYLGEFHKGVSVEQLKRLTSDAKAASPLYLRVVAEELRLHGEHETLDEEITRHTSASNLDEVFQRVLQRLERDYGETLVREVLSSIRASRSGLGEVELLELLGLTRLELSRLLLALDYHLLLKDGLLGFFHNYLQRAVEKRYLTEAENRRRVHHRLSDHFHGVVVTSVAAKQGISLRAASELAYQLYSSEAWEALSECLTTIPVFSLLYTGLMQYDVMAYWATLRDMLDMEMAYRTGLAQWTSEDAEERSRVTGRVADLLEQAGRWEGSLALHRERRDSAIARGDRDEEAASRQSLGWMLHLRGKRGEAFDELSRARDLFTELGDDSGVARALGNIGVVYFHRGEYDQAMECQELALSIYEEMGDRNRALNPIVNMGVVYVDRGNYDLALECYQRALGIGEELGNRRIIAAAIGNMGALYGTREEYDRAMECYQRALSINQELGDRRGVAAAITNKGRVYIHHGEYDQALECYQRALNINEELGDRIGLANSFGDMGSVYFDRDEYDRALKCYQQQLSISEELGDRSAAAFAAANMGLIYGKRREHGRALESLYRAAPEYRALGIRSVLIEVLQSVAMVLMEIAATEAEMPEYLPTHLLEVTQETWRDVSLRMAREHVEECLAISGELQGPDTLFSSNVLLSRLDATERRRDAAVSRLYTMLQEAADDDQRADLHYWLWKLEQLPDSDEHRNESLRLYRSLFEATSKHYYRNRIDELTVATTPPDTTDPTE